VEEAGSVYGRRGFLSGFGSREGGGLGLLLQAAVFSQFMAVGAVFHGFTAYKCRFTLWEFVFFFFFPIPPDLRNFGQKLSLL
jgi:hypothetical protein